MDEGNTPYMHSGILHNTPKEGDLAVGGRVGEAGDL